MVCKSLKKKEINKALTNLIVWEFLIVLTKI